MLVKQIMYDRFKSGLHNGQSGRACLIYLGYVGTRQPIAEGTAMQACLNWTKIFLTSIFWGLVRTHRPRAEGIVAFMTNCRQEFQFPTIFTPFLPVLQLNVPRSPNFYNIMSIFVPYGEP